MDVASWCYKCSDWWDWISLGGVRYRAPYGAKNSWSPRCPNRPNVKLIFKMAMQGCPNIQTEWLLDWHNILQGPETERLQYNTTSKGRKKKFSKWYYILFVLYRPNHFKWVVGWQVVVFALWLDIRWSGLLFHSRQVKLQSTFVIHLIDFHPPLIRSRRVRMAFFPSPHFLRVIDYS